MSVNAIWFASLFIPFLGSGKFSDVTSYIPMETQPTTMASFFFPLKNERIHFGLEYVRQPSSSHICPRIVFNSKHEGSNENKNLQLFLCLGNYGIENAVDVLQEEEAETIAENKFRSLWFQVNSTNGSILFGREHNTEPFFVYNFTSYFNQSYFTHFGFAGSGRWILESDTPYIIADSQDRERSTTYIQLNTNTLLFGVKIHANAKFCPRIILAPRVEWFSDYMNLNVIFCQNFIIVDHGKNSTTVEHHKSSLDGSMTGYWLRINQLDGILQLGNHGNRMHIFEYDFSNDFNNNYFIDHFAISGSGHWMINFGLDSDDFSKNFHTFIAEEHRQCKNTEKFYNK